MECNGNIHLKLKWHFQREQALAIMLVNIISSAIVNIIYFAKVTVHFIVLLTFDYTVTLYVKFESTSLSCTYRSANWTMWSKTLLATTSQTSHIYREYLVQFRCLVCGYVERDVEVNFRLRLLHLPNKLMVGGCDALREVSTVCWLDKLTGDIMVAGEPL